MNLSIIVAVSSNHVIGLRNRLPWHLPADLKYFKKITTGHAVIMGRKTFESMGKPLPGRKNIVITRQDDYKADGTFVVHSLDHASALCPPDDESFIIGGAEIIHQSMEVVNRIYLTRIHHAFEGDTFFPEPDPGRWKEVSAESHEPDEKNAYAYTFFQYERIPKP